MSNIFEGAKFGDAYKTRDGRKLIFNKSMPQAGGTPEFQLRNSLHYLMEEGITAFLIEYQNDGTTRFGFGTSSELRKSDIIGKWNEPMSEEELREMSYEADYTLNSYTDKCESFHEGFHAGYRKAEERLL